MQNAKHIYIVTMYATLCKDNDKTSSHVQTKIEISESQLTVETKAKKQLREIYPKDAGYADHQLVVGKIPNYIMEQAGYVKLKQG